MMSTKVSIRLIGSKVADQTESVIFSEDLDFYDPVEVGSAVYRVIQGYQLSADQLKLEGFCLGDSPQISVIVSMLGDGRPSFFLSEKVIGALSEIGASFDFDPYS